MRKICLVVALSLLLTSCGGRLPSPNRAQHLIQKYFTKYGKKNRDTDFGHHKITKVEISAINELQKHIVEVEGFTMLADDGGVYQIRATMEKKAFGWKVLNWENLGHR